MRTRFDFFSLVIRKSDIFDNLYFEFEYKDSHKMDTGGKNDKNNDKEDKKVKLLNSIYIYIINSFQILKTSHLISCFFISGKK